MTEQNDATTPKKEPNASEAMFFFAIVKHTRNKADIDWDAVAVEQNFKSAEVAKVRFGQVKRKLGISSTAETPTSSARASGKKRDNSTAATPTKVAKNTGRVGGKGRGRGKVKSVVEESPTIDEEPLVKDEPAVPGDEREDVKEEFFDPPSQFEEEMMALGKRDESV
ncbi:hypothetical protein HRG_002472 [Hirsutella rhossiliensis]|uniref:Myb-like DNA-binding domain-containing protein n=1 Tax=Hirsutella rhossiliensis TaxID=111463 RepID=A0A9P8N3N6_9HYPO|nr:uncharacterized protein HRG_02472 [Hirsutella rhossiliensis]KAH0967063.1 hypothetical protein HRG_02472 [Hirsutella rhossiliensis]